MGIVADDKDSLTNTISENLEKYDVIIITGGASVGDFDFMPAILNSLGATIHFDSLNIQPGKPVLFATLGKTHILGLSGNPVSSFLQFLIVAKLLILRLAGCKANALKIVKTPLSESIKRKKGNRQLYVPVTFTQSGYAKPVTFNGSAHITALSGIDGFAVINVGVNEILEGQLADILLL